MRFKNERGHFYSDPIVIICFILQFVVGIVFMEMMRPEGPQKRVFEISHSLGFLRSDLENLLQAKIKEYATMAGGPARSEIGDEIDSLNDLLELPNYKAVTVKIYSPKGEAKTINDKTAMSFLVSGDTGWTLANICLEGEQ